MKMDFWALLSSSIVWPNVGTSYSSTFGLLWEQGPPDIAGMLDGAGGSWLLICRAHLPPVGLLSRCKWCLLSINCSLWVLFPLPLRLPLRLLRINRDLPLVTTSLISILLFQKKPLFLPLWLKGPNLFFSPALEFATFINFSMLSAVKWVYNTHFTCLWPRNTSVWCLLSVIPFPISWAFHIKEGKCKYATSFCCPTPSIRTI